MGYFWTYGSFFFEVTAYFALGHSSSENVVSINRKTFTASYYGCYDTAAAGIKSLNNMANVNIARLQSCSPPITLPSRVVLPSPARRARSTSHNESPTPQKARTLPQQETFLLDRPLTASRQRCYLALTTADTVVWIVATPDEV